MRATISGLASLALPRSREHDASQALAFSVHRSTASRLRGRTQLIFPVSRQVFECPRVSLLVCIFVDRSRETASIALLGGSRLNMPESIRLSNRVLSSRGVKYPDAWRHQRVQT